MIVITPSPRNHVSQAQLSTGQRISIAVICRGIDNQGVRAEIQELGQAHGQPGSDNSVLVEFANDLDLLGISLS